MKNSHAAAKLGSTKSTRKAESSKRNGAIQPHINKVAHFETVYPYQLINNEWKFKFELETLTPSGKKKSKYNPDFYCPTTEFYIEVATSVPNISECGPRWEEAIRLGLKLKVFWWEGEEITNKFI